MPTVQQLLYHETIGNLENFIPFDGNQKTLT